MNEIRRRSRIRRTRDESALDPSPLEPTGSNLRHQADILSGVVHENLDYCEDLDAEEEMHTRRQSSGE